jgi:23S rRNA (cytosine1962-C5)-methyltransferase
MVRPDTYVLLDCGDGRRLEQFGPLLLDRPAPGATFPRRAPDRWSGAIVYRAGAGWQSPEGGPPADEGHAIAIAGVVMDVRPAASGAVGLFPEHAANAGWLTAAARSRVAQGASAALDAPEVLNLFAYTGLASLVAARAGAKVVHVDASRPSVLWARRNAELSGLADRPIRWIVDEAITFVRREARRGRRYAGLILDPPSYGHGARAGGGARTGRAEGSRDAGSAATWRFDERIDELLDACAGVAEPDAFWLLTAHTPGWDPFRLAGTLAIATDAPATAIEAVELRLAAESGAVLGVGAAARFDPLRAERR